MFIVFRFPGSRPQKTWIIQKWNIAIVSEREGLYLCYSSLDPHGNFSRISMLNMNGKIPVLVLWKVSLASKSD